jgi:hypothetical protein
MTPDQEVPGYLRKLQALVELQATIQTTLLLFLEYYPIAIYESDHVFIFDFDKAAHGYELVGIESNTMGLFHGVRAAFPLACYHNRACVVVSGEVFDSLWEVVAVFHEMVHCYQFNTCEVELRATLEIERTSVNTSHYSWELHYPFPYDDSKVAALIDELLEQMADRDLDKAFHIRNELRLLLNTEQYEYLVWQEWKEGFARFIENKVRKQLGIDDNHAGAAKPYTRTTLYETGSRLIACIMNECSDCQADSKKLFHIMMDNAMQA